MDLELEIKTLIKERTPTAKLKKNGKGELTARIPWDQKRWLKIHAGRTGYSLSEYLAQCGLGKTKPKSTYTESPLPSDIADARAKARFPVVSVQVGDDEWGPLLKNYTAIYKMPALRQQDLVRFCVSCALGEIQVPPAKISSSVVTQEDLRVAAKERLVELVELWLRSSADDNSIRKLTGKEKDWATVVRRIGGWV